MTSQAAALWEAAAADCAHHRLILLARVAHLESLVVAFAEADRAWFDTGINATIHRATALHDAEAALRLEANQIRAARSGEGAA